MITKPTTLILGAGASAPFGFPTGYNLPSQVLSLADLALSGGNPRLLAQLEQPVQVIEKFRAVLSKSGQLSVDSFLERQPDFTPIGKALMAVARICHEKENALFKRDGATITPFGGSSYYTPAHETTRTEINTWFRTNTIYDGLIDFDAVVRDPGAPVNLLPAYSSDGLHLSVLGYQAMADAINLTLFTP